MTLSSPASEILCFYFQSFLPQLTSSEGMRSAGKRNELQDLELLKAVAQAWHAHAGEANPSKEFDARRTIRAPLRRPSRFKLEADAAASAEAAAAAASSWDFGSSLWDSYEIVTIAKQLEACSLDLDRPLPLPLPATISTVGNRHGKRRRDGRNSLRSLFDMA
ncbi:hypothetical protein KSP39_PZI011620 [Platanthera zijinensis]|uniref:Uncharacterized protein n=1 Tax=Platanthera zijinensis TaxID=2320716 RepID=A0AAP0BIL5_9ASPA